MTPDQIIEDFKNIMIGVKHLHRKGISHMDIVPRNIYLIRENNISTIKLGNFGCFIRQGKDVNSLFTMLIDYDKRLKPPEFFIGAQYPLESRFASDVWMIGTSFVAFLTGMDSLLADS